MLTLVLLAQLMSHEASQWCVDRVVGENSRGRYSVSYMWEAENLSNGTAVCQPMNMCSTGDLNGDGTVGIDDFEVLVGCIGLSIDDILPPR